MAKSFIGNAKKDRRQKRDSGVSGYNNRPNRNIEQIKNHTRGSAKTPDIGRVETKNIDPPIKPKSESVDSTSVEETDGDNKAK